MLVVRGRRFGHIELSLPRHLAVLDCARFALPAAGPAPTRSAEIAVTVAEAWQRRSSPARTDRV